MKYIILSLLMGVSVFASDHDTSDQGREYSLSPSSWKLSKLHCTEEANSSAIFDNNKFLEKSSTPFNGSVSSQDLPYWILELYDSDGFIGE